MTVDTPVQAAVATDANANTTTATDDDDTTATAAVTLSTVTATAAPSSSSSTATSASSSSALVLADAANSEPRRIVQLEETVINRIAAGEVVVRPANALKEMLENCLDAGSKHIVVAVKAGGLKLLRIEDDGHGIRSEDLPILCERFTTSKLRKYEDLSQIATFGFRGEALASISHVAHVTVTTMTREDSTAKVAQYSDGKLRSAPRACAGTRGTTISVEDMFYNNPTRRQALGKDSIEHAKVLDVVQKYAIHYPKVSFTCRKAAGAVAELHSLGGEEGTNRQAISAVLGGSLASHLFDYQVSSTEPEFSCRGLATGPQWTARSFTLTVFINNRLVECPGIKRAVENAFQPVLPRHQYPWIYVALDLPASTIDVNVHPTKSTVQFLHEEAICQKIEDILSSELTKRAGTRTFETQTSLLASLNGQQQPVGKGSASGKGGGRGKGGKGGAGRGPQKPPPADLSSQLDLLSSLGASQEDPDKDLELSQPASQMPNTQEKVARKVELNPVRIRTDHRQRSLQALWRQQPGSSEALVLDKDEGECEEAAAEGEEGEAEAGDAADAGEEVPPLTDLPAAAAAAAAASAAPLAAPAAEIINSNNNNNNNSISAAAPTSDLVLSAAGGDSVDSDVVPVPTMKGEDTRAARVDSYREAQQLTSIAELKAACALESHDKEFSTGLNQSVFVGAVSRDVALLQCGSALCVANLTLLGREFAYQRLLRLFGGCGRIALREPLPLDELLSLGIMDPNSGYTADRYPHVDVEGLTSQLQEFLEGKSELLEEYLEMEIRDGAVWSLPNALGLTSDSGLKFDELPIFLVRLCADVNWEEERPCFENLCRLVADFAVESILPDPEDVKLVMDSSVADASEEAASLNAAVEAGEFEDIVAAAAAAKRKRQRTQGSEALQELRYIHEAIRSDAAAAGLNSCRWPARLRKDGTVIQLVALEQLYRIFERC